MKASNAAAEPTRALTKPEIHELDLIKDTPREEVLAKIRDWDSSVAKKEIQKKIRRKERRAAKIFVQLCLRSFDGCTVAKLNKLTDEQLSELDAVLTRKAVIPAAGTILALPGVSVAVYGLLGLSVKVVGSAGALSSFLGVLGVVVGSIVGILFLGTYISFFTDVGEFLNLKYLWHYRPYLKKFYGKDYFPREKVRALLKNW